MLINSLPLLILSYFSLQPDKFSTHGSQSLYTSKKQSLNLKNRTQDFLVSLSISMLAYKLSAYETRKCGYHRLQCNYFNLEVAGIIFLCLTTILLCFVSMYKSHDVCIWSEMMATFSISLGWNSAFGSNDSDTEESR